MRLFLPFRARNLIGLLAASVMLVARSAAGIGLTNGLYQFQVPYSPVCLNGVYPITVGVMDTDCFLGIKMDANGALKGTVDLRTLKGSATGAFLLNDNTISLRLETSGQDVTGVPSQIDAALQASEFVGTVTTSMGSVPCSMDVSSAAPLRVTFDLAITVDENGKIAGSGTATGCGVQVAVTAEGSNTSQTCTLRLTGVGLPGFVWEGSGKPTHTGFTAAWSARGFGVSKTGDGVVVARKAMRPAHLGNISTRLNSQTGDNVLIGGFIITGTQPKKVIIREIGPSLPLSGKLADPKLALHDATGATVASNDNWKEASNKQAIIDSTVPPSNDKESAIVASLSPGAYTAIVSGVNDTSGIALVEVYDLSPAADSKLANISTRGLVQTGDNVLIGGFIVLGTEAQKVIVRAIGPSLPLSNKLSDPSLALHDPNGQLLAANDDWISDHGAEITATKVQPSSPDESAIVATVVPGPYTAIVRGVNGTTGVAVVEVYGLNP